jgi:DNA polymerase I-like protein with 3'-5' exonuclease and polymerase domains
MRRGKQVVAFVHDEIIAEVPAATAEQEREEIEHVMCESMAEVLNHLVPVACEGVVTPYWVKG